MEKASKSASFRPREFERNQRAVPTFVCAPQAPDESTWSVWKMSKIRMILSPSVAGLQALYKLPQRLELDHKT